MAAMLPQIAAGVVSGVATEAIMSDRTVSDREPIGPRQPVTIGRALPWGNPIARDAGGRQIVESAGQGAAVTPGVFFPFQGREGGSPFLNPSNIAPGVTVNGVSRHIDQATDDELDTTNRSDGPTPIYGTDDPFSILADLALRLFPNQETTPTTTYVPVLGSSGGGGSSAAVLLLIVAGIGGGVWYYFKKRRASNGG